MDRIILHWTAGGYKVSDLDKEHYHFIVDGDGKVIAGKFAPEANAKPAKGQYAAHTLNCNTGSIGVAVAGMAGAVERPFNAGKQPITAEQIDKLAWLVADLCGRYGIPVTRETVLTHAEVQPTLGIKQRGKWDIAWLPDLKGPIDPVKAGDKLRAMVQAKIQPPSIPRSTPIQPARTAEAVQVQEPATRPAPAFSLAGLLKAIFGKGK